MVLPRSGQSDRLVEGGPHAVHVTESLARGGEREQQLVASYRIGRSGGPLDLQGAAPQRPGLVEGSAPLGGDCGLPPVGDGALGRVREVRRRDGVVVGHVAQQLGVGHQPRGQAPADHGVPAGPLPGRQVGVDRLAGERVHEPEAPRPVGLLHDAGRHRRVDVFEHAVAQRRRQHAGVEAASHHRGHAERCTGGLVELEDAESQHVGDAVGDLEPLGLRGRRPAGGDEQARHLEDEERVAVGTPRQHLDQGRLRLGHDLGEQLGDRSGVERRHRDPAHGQAGQARQRMGEVRVQPGVDRAHGGDEQHRLAAQLLGGVRQEAQGGLVSPVQVLDEHDQAAGLCGEQPRDRGEGPQRRRRGGPGTRGRGRQIGLPLEQVDDLGRHGVPGGREVAQHGQPRPVRRRQVGLVTAADDHPDATVAGALDDLGGEHGLADPRVAADQQDATLARVDEVGEGVVDRRQRSGPTDDSGGTRARGVDRPRRCGRAACWCGRAARRSSRVWSSRVWSSRASRWSSRVETRPVEARVLGEHALLELADRRRRVDAELVDEGRPQQPQRLEGVGLAVAAVEGERQERPQALPKGVGAHQGRQGAVGLLGSAEVQQRLRASLHQDQPHLLQPGRLQGERGCSPETDVRRATPQAQRGVGRLQRRGRVEGTDPLDGEREEVGVDLGAHEGVAGRVAAYLGVVPERATQARDGDLDRAGRPHRRVVAPELVDDPVVADVPAGGGREQGQQHALTPPAHGPLVVADADPQGPEHVDADHPAFIGQAPSSGGKHMR